MSGECFVIGPIGKEGSEEREHTIKVLERIIYPVARDEFKYNVISALNMATPGQIPNEIINQIANAELLIADLSFYNPNVYYELALRHITRKPCIHIIRKKDDIPFYFRTIRIIRFDLNDNTSIESAKNELRKQINSIRQGKFKPIKYVTKAVYNPNIIFEILKYFSSEDEIGLSYFQNKFGCINYNNKTISSLDLSESEGDKIELENVNVNWLDASNIKLKDFNIKNSVINLLDISGSNIDNLILENSKVNILDAYCSQIKYFKRVRTEIVKFDSTKAKFENYIEID